MANELKNPRVKTIRALFAISGNQCAFSGCEELLYDVTADKVVGKICHIRARQPGGKRYDPNQSAEERHGIANLVLLCSRHHDIVDSDEATYTVDHLLQMKAEHERRFQNGYEADDSVAEALIRNSGPLVSIGDVVVSVNQQGGITAHTVVQQAPEPDLQISEVSANRLESDGLYHSYVVVTVIAPYPVGNLALEVHAATIRSMDVNPMRSGIFMQGHSGTREGHCFTNIPQASRSYRLDLTTAKPERFEIRYDFQ